MSEQPTRPYSGYLEGLTERMQRDIAAAEPLHSDHAGAAEQVRAEVTRRVEAIGDDLVELSHDIHGHPELGFAEHHAVEAVARLLQRHGHDAEVGAYGVDTALRARAGGGRPSVALLAEYDALPGIGHACGHNVICCTAVGAFLALAGMADEFDGSVELIGTPAEEGGGGKELIARAGGFDEIDAALMLHPSGFEAGEHPWIGVRQVGVAYHGLSAHASAMPFMGCNALDAVVNAYTGIAQLRQHMLATDRVHGVITDGGAKPNIVPDYAAATFYLRSAEPDTLAELTARATQIFKAAAMSTGTRVEFDWDLCPVYLPVRSNHVLAARYAANMESRGRQVLPKGILPEALTGSTDLGNVSVRVPAIHPTMAIAPASVAIHTPQFAEWAVSDRADKGTIDGAIGLAATAVDFLSDSTLRDDARSEFEASGGIVDIDALLS